MKINISPKGLSILTVFINIFLLYTQGLSQMHEVRFCGELIPVNRDVVATKLMNIIRRQIPNVNLPSLHKRSLAYFPKVTSYLDNYGIPEDFKYLPIIESSFTLERTESGARGIWQFMLTDGRDYGLVTDNTDDRDDFEKSTVAACKELRDYHNRIQNRYHISSWVLTAAAYNFGIGAIFKAMGNQGTDYFSMKLNSETANYVYKIVAVKELFEYPELYMKDFGYNVFNSSVPPQQTKPTIADTSMFNKMSLSVGKAVTEKVSNVKLVGAHIKGKYKIFHDGDLITVQLDEDLLVQGGFTKRGTTLKPIGWIIDNRIYFDLGYGHDVLLEDIDGQRGIPINHLKNNEPVLLINQNYDDQSNWK